VNADLFSSSFGNNFTELLNQAHAPIIIRQAQCLLWDLYPKQLFQKQPFLDLLDVFVRHLSHGLVHPSQPRSTAKHARSPIRIVQAHLKSHPRPRLRRKPLVPVRSHAQTRAPILPHRPRSPHETRRDLAQIPQLKPQGAMLERLALDLIQHVVDVFHQAFVRARGRRDAAGQLAAGAETIGDGPELDVTQSLERGADFEA